MGVQAGEQHAEGQSTENIVNFAVQVLQKEFTEKARAFNKNEKNQSK